MKKWSGDHGSYDYQTTADVLVPSRNIVGDTARIIDIGPTVLTYLGIAIPGDIDGKPLF